MALSFLSTKKFHHLHARFISVTSQLVDTLLPVVSVFICLLLAALGLRCPVGLPLAAVCGGCSLVAMQGLLLIVTSLSAKRSL